MGNSSGTYQTILLLIVISIGVYFAIKYISPSINVVTNKGSLNVSDEEMEYNPINDVNSEDYNQKRVRFQDTDTVYNTTNQEQQENFGNTNNTVSNNDIRAISCFPKDQLNPEELLPKDSSDSSTWAKVNPNGIGSLKNRNFLQAGHHIGINTVGQTLRNANLQIRSEPANPQVNVSPWLQTTISPDVNRKPLEIGGSA